MNEGSRDDAANCLSCGRELPADELLDVCDVCAMRSLSASEDELEGDDLFPGYTLECEEPIGAGGMGTVYKGRQQGVAERFVAIKVINQRLGGEPQALLRFEQEIASVVALDHPGVAKVFDAGMTSDGRPYYVMEWIEGVEASRWLDEHPMDEKQLVDLMCDICEAVQAAHSKGILHRDLKPGNVMILQDGTPKLVDFGISKRMEGDENRELTVAGQIVATPRYASPEQARHELTGLPADVFALGVMLYEWLTDAHPLGENDFGESYLHTLANAEPIAARRVNSQLDQDLEAVVMKALETNPELRYQSAGELAADLKNYLARRPVTARTLTTYYQLSRLASRNRGAVIAAVSALVAIGIWGTVHFLQITAANRELAEANREKQIRLVQSLKAGAELAGQRGLWEDSRVYLREALAEQPTNTADIYLRLVEASLALGEREQAMQDLSNARSAKPGWEESSMIRYWEAHLESDEESALARLREAVEEGLPVVRRHIAEAMLVETTVEAQDSLKAALDQRPYDKQAMTLLSISEMFGENPKGARERLEAAARLYPKDIDLRSYLAMGHAFEGDLQGAMAIVSTLPKKVATPLQIQVEALHLGADVYGLFWGRGTPQVMQTIWKVLMTGGQVESGQQSALVARALRIARSRETQATQGVYLKAKDLPALLKIAEAELGSEKIHRLTSVTVAASLLEHARRKDDESLLVKTHELCAAAYPHTRRPGVAAVLCEIAAAARFLRFQEHDDAESRKTAIDWTRKRLALPVDFKHSTPAWMLGQGAMLLEEWDLARELVDAQIRLKPERAGSLLNLCRVEFGKGHHVAGLNVAKRLLAMDDLEEEERERAERYKDRFMEGIRQQLEPE